MMVKQQGVHIKDWVKVTYGNRETPSHQGPGIGNGRFGAVPVV